MEGDLNYATVAFKAKNGISTLENPNEVEIIYDEVKPEVQTAPVKPVSKEKAPLRLCIYLVAAVQTARSEQLQNINNLKAQNQQLMSEKNDSKRHTEELTRERDGLNWTLGAILEYKNFPVETLCPQKVCKPCQDNWVLFQSSCYLFTKHEQSRKWLTWSTSENECQKLYANLVVIESLEEQEFINNHTEKYNDENHGYWIGLNKKDSTEEWRWLDGSNLTLTFWRKQETILSWYRCASTSPHGNPQTKWQKTGCDMKNRYICETRVLTKQEEETSTSS
ncbi:C-type lectin domain family 6 member A-like isoform X2 [Halichoeres trimaculatus]|uniref:C-type lectin domain family 6 member A-like isoform X2 n=1 Tax=Halichoeres trimaculatus TaxID=147232 RepID=UPI003D9F6B48